MKFSKKEQWIIFSVINAVVLITILLFPIYCKYVPKLPLGKCSLLGLFHLYCPACGGTRALNALLHFDILDSLMYNPMIIIGLVWLIAYETAMIVYLFKKGSRPVLIKTWMVYLTLGIWGVYSVGRNLLLIWNIDLLGNVI